MSGTFFAIYKGKKDISMRKDDVQKLLEQFGFSVTLNRALEGVSRTHMMHTLASGKKMVDYYIDEAVGMISQVFGFSYDDCSMDRFEDEQTLEIWLKS